MLSKLSVKIILGVLVLFGSVTATVYATHAWGNYHWARITNPFTLKLGDNVSSAWKQYLGTASSDWSVSGVLDTAVVAGETNPKRCRPVTGRVEVCSERYGFNGWLGLAQIWISGDHITKAVTKLNDTYFNITKYNTPPWRNLVMCQEVGHTFGLAHQDEIFNNPNLGTCMDYTNDPDGPLSNEHPNQHDYEQLETIYAHGDSITTVGQSLFARAARGDVANVSQWGQSVLQDGIDINSLYESNLGGGDKIFTFILWAD